MADISSELRGAAAISEMLGMIGNAHDADLARVFCENEIAIRKLLAAALKELCESV